MRTWIEHTSLEGTRVTVRRSYDQYKKQHARAGGSPKELRQAAKGALMKMALQGDLLRTKASDANTMLNLFPGGQSAQIPAEIQGLNPIHIDIMKDYPLEAFGKAVSVRETTDLARATEGEMIGWVA